MKKYVENYVTVAAAIPYIVSPLMISVVFLTGTLPFVYHVTSKESASFIE